VLEEIDSLPFFAHRKLIPFTAAAPAKLSQYISARWQKRKLSGEVLIGEENAKGGR
jgi:hypothetical protein